MVNLRESQVELSPAQENPQVYEQTARVKFDNGDERSIPTKYIMRRLPQFVGQEVLILRGEQEGPTTCRSRRPQ